MLFRTKVSDLDNVDEGWISYSRYGFDDLLAEAHYVIDPTSSIPTNLQLTIKYDKFTWANINNNEGIQLQGNLLLALLVQS